MSDLQLANGRLKQVAVIPMSDDGPEPGAEGLGLRKLARDTRNTLGRQILSMFFGLGLTILLARGLGPHGNGLYALAILIPTLLATFLNPGIGAANVYFVGTGSVSLRAAKLVSLRIGAAASVTGLVVGVLLVWYRQANLPADLTRADLVIALACFPLALVQQLLASLLQAKGAFRAFNRAILAFPVTTLTLVGIAAAANFLSVPIALIAYLLGLAVSAAITWTKVERLQRTETGKQRSRTVEHYAKRAMGYGWKAQASNSLTLLVYRIDIVLVALYLSPAAVGIYAVATQIGERLWIPSQAVSTVLLPRLAQLQGSEAARSVLTPLISRWTLALSIFGAALVAIVAHPLVHVAFGARFHGVVVPLLLLLPGVALLGSARVLANDLAARGRPELNLYAAIAALIINVGANVALIPAMGVAGAALSSTITYGLETLFLAYIYQRLSGNSILRTLMVQRSDANLLRGWMGGTRLASRRLRRPSGEEEQMP
jgi:O-antigen/teichoic acid export membrane protein